MPPALMHRLQFPLAALVLAGALLLGGGQGTPGDAAVQLASLALLALVLWRHATDATARLPRTAWLAAAVLALPLLQLLPLPAGPWAWPAARDELALELAAAGVVPAHRLSLVPVATERALAWLWPAVALFLAVPQLAAGQREALLKGLVVFAAASVVLGFAQIAGGPDSGLRFYDTTNTGASVGFFANRNHLASLLALALPLVVVGSARWLAQRDGVDAGTVLGLLAGIGLVALLILGIAIARSRAGLLLGMLGLLASLPIVLGLRRRRRGTRRVLAVAVALGLTLAVQFALFGILQRLQADPLEDARFRFLPVVTAVAEAHAPLGTGLGGFRRAFEAEQHQPEDFYVNQAHNDWAQLWLEGGWPAGALLAAAVAALLASGWQAWRRRDDDGATRALRRAAWLGLALLALHSLADYPLRTTALLATAGLLAGVLATGHRGPRHDFKGMDAPHAT